MMLEFSEDRELTLEERQKIRDTLEVYLENVSYSYLVRLYKTKLGHLPRDQRSSKILIKNLLKSLESPDISWRTFEINEIINRVKIEREIKKPRTVNILRVNLAKSGKIDLNQIKMAIEENLYSMEDANSLPGFEIVEFSKDNRTDGNRYLEFRYWYLKSKKILTEAFDIQEISYRMYIPIKIKVINRSPNVLVYIYSRTAADVELAKRILREILGIQLADTGLKNKPPKEANDIFNKFLLELEQIIESARNTNLNESSVPPLWIEDVYISTKLATRFLKDQEGNIIKDANGNPINLYANTKRISVKGRNADLYSYPVVKQYMDDGGKVIGVRGEFEYVEHEYKFSAGYTEGLKTVNHVKFSIKPKGRVPPTTEEFREVREMLRKLVEKHFVFV
ncbi:hypothetical protein TQ32_02615 [Pyrococcus kukulkanii]|uniref:Uncharacterized protein n=2 Tax=Pyrococcus kukulkanii TaxID=1609559 RepID=A0A127B890_9EURY|nr:hypothetical protein TQ32_02615 [Pyrococcus kukulkanii]